MAALRVAALALLLASSFGCGVAVLGGGVVGGLLLTADEDASVPATVAPEVRLEALPETGVSDQVSVDFALIQPDSAPADVHFEVSFDGGPYRSATESLTQSRRTQSLATSRTGRSHTFVWNSSADVGFRSLTGVRLRARARLSARPELQGEAAEVGPLSVRNEDLAILRQRPRASSLNPVSAAFLDAGRLALVDPLSASVFVHELESGRTILVAGTGEPGSDLGEASATESRLGLPIDLTRMGSELLVADLQARSVRSVNLKTGFSRAALGPGDEAPDGALAPDASLDPLHLAADSRGLLYVLTTSGELLALNRAVQPITVLPGRADEVLPGRLRVIVGPTEGLLRASLARTVAIELWEEGPESRLLYLLDLGESARLNVLNLGSVAVELRQGSRSLTSEPGTIQTMGELELAGERLTGAAALAAGLLLLGTERGALALNPTSTPRSLLGLQIRPGDIATVAGTVAGTQDNAGPARGGERTPPDETPLRPILALSYEREGGIALVEQGGRVRLLRDLSDSATQARSLRVLAPDALPDVVRPRGIAVLGARFFVADSLEGDARSNRIYELQGVSTDALVPLAGTGLLAESVLTDETPSLPELGDLIAWPERDLLLFTDRSFGGVYALNPTESAREVAGVEVAPGALQRLSGRGPTAARLEPLPLAQLRLEAAQSLAMPRPGLLFVGLPEQRRLVALNLTDQPLDLLGEPLPGLSGRAVSLSAAGEPAGDGGPLSAASFGSLAVRASGTQLLLILDGRSARRGGVLRAANLGPSRLRIAGQELAAGQIMRVAGSLNGSSASAATINTAGLLSLTQIPLEAPESIVLRRDGLAYLSDSRGQRIWALNLADDPLRLGELELPPGTGLALLGSGQPRGSGDPIDFAPLAFGAQQQGEVNGPASLLLVQDQALFYADEGARALRLANTGSAPIGVAGLTVQSGQAAVVLGARDGGREIFSPRDLTIDERGDLLFADLEGFRLGLRQLDVRTRAVQLLADFELAFGRRPVLEGFRAGAGLEVSEHGQLLAANTSAGSLRCLNRSQSEERFLGLALPAGASVEIARRGGDGVLGNAVGERVGGERFDLAEPTDVAIAGGAVWIVDRNGLVSCADELSGRLLAQRDLRARRSLGEAGFVAESQLRLSTSPSEAVLPGDRVTIELPTGAQLCVAGEAATQRTFEVSSTSGMSLTLQGSVKLEPAGARVQVEAWRPSVPVAVAGFVPDAAIVATENAQRGFSRVYLLRREGGQLSPTLLCNEAGLSRWNGDTLPSSEAACAAIRDVAVSAGLVLAVDSVLHRILAINPTDSKLSLGSLSVPAHGAATALGSGRGEPGRSAAATPPENVLLSSPQGVAVDADGALYVSDSGNGRLLRIKR